LQNAVTIQCGQLFHIRENQVVNIRRPDKPGAPAEKHLVTGFTRPIAQTGQMQINATSIGDAATVTIVYPGGQNATAQLNIGAISTGQLIIAYATAE
jgi:uncharacterized protein YijF (DUF1287 family)